MTEYFVELRTPGKPPERRAITAAVEVGRECDGWIVSDPKMSRRHVRFEATAEGLVVEDLGSTNGTLVNDTAITGPTVLHAGDRIRLGATDFLTSVETAPAPTDARPPTLAVAPGTTSIASAEGEDGPAVPDSPGPPPSQSPAKPRPALDELESRPVEGAMIRFRPGTAGETVAPAVGAGVRRARKRLAGLGSESWGISPQICLVDPFPDPQNPGSIVTGGTVVDAARGEIWMVVTAESPPEPPERPLALLFGAALPAAADLGLLLEGYGLVVGDAPDDDESLRHVRLPSLEEAEGELRSSLARSFVAFIIGKAGQPTFLRFLASAQPGRVDVAADDVLGTSLVGFEERWRDSLRDGGEKASPRQFLKLSLRYLRPHLRREVELGVYMLFGLVFTVIFPFAMRRLLDSAIPSGRFSQVETLLAFLSGALVVSMLASLRQSYVSAVVAGSVVKDVRAQMFEKLHQLPASWYDRHPQGDVMARLFSDVPSLQAGLSQTLQNGLFQMVSVVVSAIVALELNWLLGLIVILGAPLVAVVYKTMAKGARERSLAVQEETASFMGVAAESVSAQAVIKAFGLQARERSRFARTQERLYSKSLRLTLFGGLFEVSVQGIVMVLRVLIIGLGAWLILHGHLTIGGLVAFTGVMDGVISPVTSLTSIGQQLQAATGSLARVNEVLDAVPAIADRDGAVDLEPLRNEITLEGVFFSYRPERPTLRDLSCRIPAGAKVAFVGPTGAGKSSVMQLLMRSYDPDEGAVLFDGVDARDVTLASLRGQLGVVFQETFLFDTSIRENIALARPGATDSEVEEAARQAELHDFIATLPRGYETLVGERGGRLSGGQKQRLAIARALLRNPRVLLLDEATSALDPRTERMVAATLDRVGEGRTTISVTHRLGSVVGYDVIFVVVDGSIVEQGPHLALLEAGGVYAGLWAEQTHGAPPAEAPLDVDRALAQIPLFARLDAAGREVVAGRLRLVEMAAGTSVSEGGGQLTIVRRGRPRVVAPGPFGASVTVAQLAPGDAFGLAALLGQDSGAVLTADTQAALLVLDDDALRGLAAAFPSIGAAMTGRADVVSPVGGLRLTRATLAPGALKALPPIEPPRPVGVPGGLSG